MHLLVASAAEIGFRWDFFALAWSRPGLALLSNLAGPVQHFKAALLDSWRIKVAAGLCGRKGFRCGPLLDEHGSLQLLMLGRGIRPRLGASWLAVSGGCSSLGTRAGSGSRANDANTDDRETNRVRFTECLPRPEEARRGCGRIGSEGGRTTS